MIDPKNEDLMKPSENSVRRGLAHFGRAKEDGVFRSGYRVQMIGQKKILHKQHGKLSPQERFANGTNT